MVMAWGQFLDHDLVATPVSKGKNGASIKCCGIEEIRPECFPIQIPKDDPYFQTDCLNFVRSAETVQPDSSPTKREQINQVTSYIDASVVYGSTKDMMDKLRLFVNGQLKTSKHGLFPPQSNDTCRLTHGNEFCMFAGDFRVNVVPNLSILHLIFLREHNRIAKKLATFNPTWDDEKTFQETRKIIAALIQQISYLEYLTGVLGYKTISNYNLHIASTGFSNVYDQSVDPSIRNAFAAAAFRFGHAQITSSVLYYKHDHLVKKYNVEETYHDPHLVQNDNGQHIPDLGRWVANNASIKADRCFVSSVRDKLFIDKNNNSLDLAALNIQRGRDHGIPSYVKWRSWCGLSEVSSFDSGDGKLVDHDVDAISKLKKAYAHVDDIDLYAGGISEKHLQGADVGPTFACILGRQFQALKEGDRFWYENKFKKTGFSSATN
ncbi:hypothetical protein KUTeg_018358 [Tegillarca granosa]|uniref:Peroxidase n=1 Tax=Tegillarca granosa TaxID=220873 RepID=A0ABQ9EHX1_TEGGR|nr:hypothetical protein KUTeg_018358 [Tegillarca granosa]